MGLEWQLNKCYLMYLDFENMHLPQQLLMKYPCISRKPPGVLWCCSLLKNGSEFDLQHFIVNRTFHNNKLNASGAFCVGTQRAF